MAAQPRPTFVPTSLSFLRLTLALTGALTCLLLAACGEDAPTAPEPGTGGGEIVVLLPDSTSTERWERDDRRFLSRALEASEVSHSIVNAEGDAVQMRIQAEQAIAGGAKVLIMAPLDPASGAAITENAQLNEVVVIAYDRPTPGADFYVGPRPGAVGQALGEALTEAVDDAGLSAPSVAVLDATVEAGGRSLAAGYDSVLGPRFTSGEWTEVPRRPLTDASAARSAFERAYDAVAGDVDAILTTDDAVADAVIAALDARGAATRPLIGRGATVTGLRNVLVGEQSSSVYTPIPVQARAAVDLAVAVADQAPTANLTPAKVGTGRGATPARVIAPVAVTEENLSETVIAGGLRTWAEICAGEFDTVCPPEDER